MYISRNIDRELIRWKNEKQRKPLILRGVRQCGKTAAVRHLGESFPSYVEINLEKNVRLHRLFEDDIRIDSILARFEIETGTKIIPGETLLFLDEIQECPRAITALRYFYEEKPDLHIVAAGSLLEFALNRKKKNTLQFPVGRVRSIYMYPFSFAEYLTAVGQPLLREKLESFSDFREENPAHDRLMDHYKNFMVVGGMPEAVSCFAKTTSFLETQNVHRDIVMNFREDFDRYDSNISADNIRRVFEYSFHNACGQVRAASAVDGMTAYKFKEALDLLKRAGLVIPVKSSSCETLPLGSGEKEANIKILPFDTGIFLTELCLNTGDILGAEFFDDLNKGSLAELSTGLEFIKAADPYTEANLFYWYRSGANAEVDYVFQKGSSIIPVEVKSSRKGGMKSIRVFLDHHGGEYGIRISMENFAKYQNIQVVPLYAAGMITGAGLSSPRSHRFH